MQDSVLDFVADHCNAEPLVGLDIGGRDVNGHGRHMWPHATWTVLDIVEADGVDIVADARTWEPDRTYDVVLCTETLEHVAGWRDLIANAAKAIAPGGLLIVTCAGPDWPEHSAIDGGELRDGEHYENVPAGVLADAMARAGLILIDVRQADRDTQCAAQKPLGGEPDGR